PAPGPVSASRQRCPQAAGGGWTAPPDRGDARRLDPASGRHRPAAGRRPPAGRLGLGGRGTGRRWSVGRGGPVRRLAAAVWSALWLLVMLVGLPWVLVVVFGMPFPRHPPQQPYLHEWIISGAALLLWMVWLGLLVMVGMQVGA